MSMEGKPARGRLDEKPIGLPLQFPDSGNSVEVGTGFVVQLDNMDLPDMLSYIIVGSMSLERGAPPPYDRALRSITSVATELVEELGRRGVVNPEEVRRKASKLVDDCKKRSESDESIAAAEKLRANVEQQRKEAEDN